mgnify:CR=1 FL=1
MSLPTEWVITSEWLHVHASVGGVGWNAAQLRVLGVAWPPRKGWLSRLVGTKISREVKAEFERLRYTDEQRVAQRKAWKEQRKYVPKSEREKPPVASEPLVVVQSEHPLYPDSLDRAGRCVKCGEDAPRRFDALCASCYYHRLG